MPSARSLSGGDRDRPSPGNGHSLPVATRPLPANLTSLSGHPGLPPPELPGENPNLPLPTLQAVMPDMLGEFEPAEQIGHQLDSVQREMDALRSELNMLRRRDDTINQYLHRLDEELRLAARLQQDFLPKKLPQLGPVRFHTLFRPAGYVSGDLYDVMRLDERHVGFYIADAVGHGMPAALLTMFLKHALVTKDIAPPADPSAPGGGAKTYRLLEPGEALRRLNQTLLDQNLSAATFATALYGTIDVETLECRVAKAGHPTPMLLRHDGQVEALEADGCLLGIFPDEAFETQDLQLNPGDRIVLYTDGIEVCFADDRILDSARWRDELVRRRHLGGKQLLEDFAHHLDQESGSLDPSDDLTMMVVEVLPKG
jgi:sigma-B regulation protein RsbU (phosphoserine phosphatase)